MEAVKGSWLVTFVHKQEVERKQETELDYTIAKIVPAMQLLQQGPTS